MKKGYDAVKGVDKFADAVNVLSSQVDDVNEAAVAFVSQHRTLQQSMISMIANTIKVLDKRISENPSMYTDLRNEQSVKWIHEVAKIDSYFPTI